MICQTPKTFEGKTNQKLIKCKLCGEAATNIYEHLHHKHPKYDEKKETLSCKFCLEEGKKTEVNTKEEMKEHVKKNHKNCRKVECSICGEKVRLKDIKAHIKEQHKDYKKCNMCSGHVFVLNTPEEWKKHNRQMQHKCPKVDKIKVDKTKIVKPSKK